MFVRQFFIRRVLFLCILTMFFLGMWFGNFDSHYWRGEVFVIFCSSPSPKQVSHHATNLRDFCVTSSVWYFSIDVNRKLKANVIQVGQHLWRISRGIYTNQKQRNHSNKKKLKGLHGLKFQKSWKACCIYVHNKPCSEKNFRVYVKGLTMASSTSLHLNKSTFKNIRLFTLEHGITVNSALKIF